jgi:hypothetical protein
MSDAAPASLADIFSICRTDYYAKARLLVPGAPEAALMNVALALSHERMTGEALAQRRMADELESIAGRLRRGAKMLDRGAGK